MEQDLRTPSTEEHSLMPSSKSRFRPALFAAAFIAVAAISGGVCYKNGREAGFAQGHEAGVREISLSRTRKITYEEYEKLLDGKEDFFLLVARPTCRFCAIVDEYLSFRDNSDLPAPVYFLSLESIRGTDRYDEVKHDIGLDFVPTFRYYKGGKSLYNLNNPLDGSYFEEGATNESRNAAYAEMAEKVEAFLSGAVGNGPVINEDVLVAETGSVITANKVSEVQ